MNVLNPLIIKKFVKQKITEEIGDGFLKSILY